MGAFWVVGPQNLADEQKEVVKPAGRECRLDGRGPVPFTELVTQDMRMGHILVIFGMIRLLGIAVIRKLAADPLPVEHDPKGTQEDSF
jgi:hypothetical protein